MSFWDELSDKQMQAVNYQLEHPGATYAMIEDALAIPQSTLAKWGLKELVRTILTERRKSTEELIARSSIDAVRTLQQQLADEDHKVAQGAAKLLLAYYLGNPTMPINVSGKVDSDIQLIPMGHLTFEQLLELKQAGK